MMTLAARSEHMTRAIEHHAAAEEHVRRGVYHAVTAGEELEAAKRLVEHGEWQAYLASAWPHSARLATQYMRLARHRDQIEQAESIADALRIVSEANRQSSADLEIATPTPPPTPPPEDSRREDAQTVADILGPTRACNCVEPGVPEDAQGWTRCTNGCGGYVWVKEPASSSTNSRRALTSSDSNDWYTGDDILVPTRELLGRIDLDPASSVVANETVKAGKIYTIEDNGLVQPWFGRVFSNPPNGISDDHESMQGLFVARAIKTHLAGDIEEVVLNVNAATGAVWFRPLWDWPICFCYGRPKYSRPDGQTGHQPTHFRVVSFIAPRERWDEFRRVFEHLGYIPPFPEET